VPDGHVLVFMPGAYEIGRTVEALRREPAAAGFRVLALHGELSDADQDAAVGPAPGRKVVVATNIAETSVTIDDVRLVIDGGLARVAGFDPRRGINTLLIEKIARDAAEQRAGRAGRTAPGRCLRLWTETEHAMRPERLAPEIRRLDLAEALLTLAAARTAMQRATGGETAPSAFPWFEAPDPDGMARATRLLQDLGALDGGTGTITSLGERMAAFPLHPRFARLLLEADRRGCVGEAALLAALAQDRGLLARRPDAVARERRDRAMADETESDLFVLAAAWRYASGQGYGVDACGRMGIRPAAARRAQRVCRQLLDVAREQGLRTAGDTGGREALRRCLLAAFVDQLAVRLSAGNARFRVVHGRSGELARESVVRKAPLVVAAEIRDIEHGRGSVTTVLSLCTAVEREWLSELFPGGLRERCDTFYDAAARRVACRRELWFRDLVLESKTLSETPDADRAAALLAEEVLAGRLSLKRWDHAVEQWVQRVNNLASWCPELGLTPIGPGERRHLVEQVCYGARGGKELKDRPVRPVLGSWLSAEQRAALDALAPERLTLPNGRRAKVEYGPDGTAAIALRVQELYGVDQTLKLAMDRVPVVVRILAPNHRPVQTTTDLAGFWRDQYPAIKRQYQKRYPKHEWR
jgi:ATP-dependent helicase HrpB